MVFNVILIEPFCGGSHAQFVDVFVNKVGGDGETVRLQQVVTLDDKKWHWKARMSSMVIADAIKSEAINKSSILFISCVIDLANLLVLRPELANLRKVIYFHENQLIYPVKKKEFDWQFGFNQITSSIAADLILFNSEFNRFSFIDSIPSFLNKSPIWPSSSSTFLRETYRDKINKKSKVLYFPIDIDRFGQGVDRPIKAEVLQIVWPHRWQDDKNPSLLYEILSALIDNNVDFKISIIGEQFSVIPAAFDKIKAEFGEFVVDWGYAKTRADYARVLCRSHVVLSTADHEFFGVSVMEAVAGFGCFPLLPKRLVYPEIYPTECLYATLQQAVRKIRNFSTRPNLRAFFYEFDWSRFSVDAFKTNLERFLSLLQK